MTATSEIGPIGALPPAQVVKAAGLVREGRTISLAAVRYPGMPLFPGHPPFQVLNYRTPRGIRVTGATPWGPVNDAGLGYMAEYVMATSHSGAHMDAQFSHAISHRFAVAQIAELNLMQPSPNSSLRQSVAEAAEPFRVGFTPILLLITDEFDHGNKCSIKATIPGESRV